MAVYYVSCYTPDNTDPDRRIQGLGGTGWWKPIDDIIWRIDSGIDQFWLEHAPMPTKVIVKQHGLFGKKYLSTLPDSLLGNNLLFQPVCRL